MQQRHALAALFGVLAACLGAVAVASAAAGGRAWVIALTAGALAIWLASLAYQAVRRRR